MAAALLKYTYTYTNLRCVTHMLGRTASWTSDGDRATMVFATGLLVGVLSCMMAWIASAAAVLLMFIRAPVMDEESLPDPAPFGDEVVTA